MSNQGDSSEGWFDDGRRNSELGLTRSGRSICRGLRLRSVYFPTVKATVNAAFDLRSRSYRDRDTLLEVPADQYQATVRWIARLMDGSGPVSCAAGLEGTRRIKRGTVSYRQALRIACAGHIDGVVLDAETRAVHCDFPYGLSFALEHAYARWVGGSERAAIAMALRASLKAGPSSAVHSLLSARLVPTGETSPKSARAKGELSGVAYLPLGQGATEGTLGALASMTSPAATGQLVLLACAGPLASTVATGIGNLDLYRAALERSISWTQFTKNTVIQTTGIAIGTGGWAGGVILGSALGGPVCALIGGVAGALSAGGLGAVGAKRIADRFVEDDAMRSMAVVRQRSEQLAFEYLLTTGEIDRLAVRIKAVVDAAWLRRMFRIGRAAAKSGGGDGIAASRRFASRELDKICREIVKRRTPVVLPRASVVNVLLEEIGLLKCDYAPTRTHRACGARGQPASPPPTRQ
jgi:hypothetical protein